MGHNISGFIARLDSLTAAAKTIAGARVCALQRGFGFLPFNEDVISREDPAAEHGFVHRLTARMAEWAAEQSHGFALAYIETEYHGGSGSQCAMVWHDGVVIFGPVETGDEGGNPVPQEERAINRALRELGVECGDGRDEFEAIGLGRFRDNERWAEAGNAAGEGDTGGQADCASIPAVRSASVIGGEGSTGSVLPYASPRAGATRQSGYAVASLAVSALSIIWFVLANVDGPIPFDVYKQYRVGMVASVLALILGIAGYWQPWRRRELAHGAVVLAVIALLAFLLLPVL